MKYLMRYPRSLSEWDGKTGKSRASRDITGELTGPRGIYGNTNLKQSPFGLQAGIINQYCLVKIRRRMDLLSFAQASHSYDGAHGCGIPNGAVFVCKGTDDQPVI